MGRKLFGKPSLKRALGISAAKGRISRKIGIPLTKSGRRQKVGRMAGCCFPFLLILSLLMSLAAIADPINVKVVGVSDGDTITVLDANEKQGKVRLHGIDCPESGQAYGSKAKEFTSEACFGKTVSVDILTTDRYGRFVATVTLPDGKKLNDELVKAGLAWWYQQYAPDDVILKANHAEAEAAKRGLWADPNPIAPWDFRRGESGAKLGTLPSKSTPAPAIREQVQQADTKTAEVYITKTGTKYHRENCRYLSRSMIPIDLKSAKDGYGACSVCSPPKE